MSNLQDVKDAEIAVEAEILWNLFWIKMTVIFIALGLSLVAVVFAFYIQDMHTDIKEIKQSLVHEN